MVTVMEFYGPKCPACKVADRIIQELSQEMHLEVRRIDVMAEPALTAAHGVRSLPTMLFLRHNEFIGQETGIDHGTKARVRKLIEGR